MKYTTGENIDITDDGYIGEIYATYDKLVELFGKPEFIDCEKVDVKWKIEFEDNKVATIYNWKDGKNYRGENGLDVEDITEWHIGGVIDVRKRLSGDYTFEKLIVNRVTDIVTAE